MKRFSLSTAMVLILALGMISSPAIAQNYEGTLRVYMVEPQSRWTNTHSGQHIEQAMIGFSLVEELDLAPGSMTTYDTLWDASVSTGLSSVTSTNIEAVAAVFASEFEYADAYPPYGSWFELHEVEASAAARPGIPGADVALGGRTHSIFCEEATATWCANCPTVAANLHAAQTALGASMNYVALVEDRSSVAATRLDFLNPAGYPTVFFDGGLAVQVVDTTKATMDGYLTAVGADPVDDIGLVIRVEHITSDEFVITTRVSHGIPANAAAMTPAAPTGDQSGPPDHTFHWHAVATDSEGDELFYQFDFDDGSKSDWRGPYASGDTCHMLYDFPGEGSYAVKVRTTDVWADTSAWSPELPVTVDVASDVQRVESDLLPQRIGLSNYPNPFNPSTVIGFSLPRAGRTSLTVYNILGETVANLVDDYLSAGDYEATWDGTADDGQSVTSGIYLYRLVVGDESLSRKMTLLK